MNSSRVVTCVAPSSISILPKCFCSNSTRCWCSVCCSYSTLSTAKVMRKPRSSNSVSGSQRLSAMAKMLRHGRGGHRSSSSVKGLQSAHARDKPGHGPFTSCLEALSPLPAQVLADHDALGLERLAQHRDAGFGLGLAAHEHVERGVVRLRPGEGGRAS